MLPFCVVARFKLNSRPPALSPVPFSSARQTLSPRIRPHFPALSAQNARFLRPGVPSFRSFHSSLPKSEMFDPLFSVTCTLFARIPGVYPPGAPNQKPQARILPKPIEVSAQLPLSPVSGRHYVFISSHRYFRISCEKPYPQAYHLMAKRYRTGCILRGVQGLYLQTLS